MLNVGERGRNHARLIIAASTGCAGLREVRELSLSVQPHTQRERWVDFGRSVVNEREIKARPQVVVDRVRRQNR